MWIEAFVEIGVDEVGDDLGVRFGFEFVALGQQLFALRQRVPIVNAQMGGLRPGETKQFRLPFDTVPESWNNVMPQLVIALKW